MHHVLRAGIYIPIIVGFYNPAKVFALTLQSDKQDGTSDEPNLRKGDTVSYLVIFNRVVTLIAF